MADTDIQRKRKYDTAFDEALLKHYDRPRVLALTKDEWTAELDKEEVEIGLYDLLTSLVFMTHGTFEATKFADEHTPYSTRYNGDREELDIEIEKKDGEVEVSIHSWLHISWLIERQLKIYFRGCRYRNSERSCFCCGLEDIWVRFSADFGETNDILHCDCFLEIWKHNVIVDMAKKCVIKKIIQNIE